MHGPVSRCPPLVGADSPIAIGPTGYPQTYSRQLGSNLGGNLHHVLTSLRMRAIGQPRTRYP